MIERYFTIKTIGFYVIVGIFAAAILLVIFKTVISSIAWKHKTRLLKKHGYERCLYDVPSVGGGAFYDWRTKGCKSRIKEHDLKRMSYKQVKQKIKTDGEEQ